ncbi:MAG: M20/M25/M40 family metallo-hydrolase [Acidobacteria bacterium]|nr:M20/M25/M40 family metallo-hydrolase [Acidobacteriota bacterium]
MWLPLIAALALAPTAIFGEDAALAERARRYLVDLIRIDSSNPPGNETRVAAYLKQVAEAEGLEAELLGEDPNRLNFVARLRSEGRGRPLLLMAHSDVVPADAAQWKAGPFSGEVRNGYAYGRGALDDKSLLAAELAVMVDLKRNSIPLRRDILLLAEADEESGSTGVQWLIRNAWSKIAAESALNEGGFILNLPSGRRVFHVQTAEKIPTRVVLRARGAAAHASLPRSDNPVLSIARALTALDDVDQPVRLNSTTRHYFSALSHLQEYRWLAPLLPKLYNPQTAIQAANQIRERDPELDAQLRTTVVPTILQAGSKINVIPNMAEAQLDVRRLPNETREEVMARLRRIINDNCVELEPAIGQEMPPAEPSSTGNALYHAMEQVFREAAPTALVVPYMQRGATDGAFLRKQGMPVYGVPLFAREDDSHPHGNDERISLRNLDSGTSLLWKIVLAACR